MYDNITLTMPATRLNGVRLVDAQSAGPVPRCSDWPAMSRADRLAIVGQLASGLAHEMNTPLGSISGHAEELLEILDQSQPDALDGARLDELRGRLRAIMRQARRCGQIASRLLQFAHGGRSPAAQSNVNQVVAQVVSLLGPAARAARINIAVHLHDQLPKAPIGATELEQLLINLIQNSFDACMIGGTITVAVQPIDGQLQLTVSDNGCGIKQEILDRIFDPFFTTKPIGTATGLGLSVCLGIVTATAGSIEVQSQFGQGTRVIVLLPLPQNITA